MKEKDNGIFLLSNRKQTKINIDYKKLQRGS